MKGFTLIETLIVAAISSLLLFSFFGFSFLFIRNLERVSDKAVLRETASAVLGRIATDVRQSHGISPFSDNNALILSYPPGYLSYDFFAGKVRRSQGASNSYLSDDGQLSGINFSYPFIGGVNICVFYPSGSLSLEAGARN